LLQTLAAATMALAGALALLFLARLPMRWYLARVGAVAAFVVWFVVLLPFVLHDREPVQFAGIAVPYGLIVAVVLCLKAFATVTLMLANLGTTPLPETLKAARALHMPGLIVHVAMLAYRYLFVVAGEFARLRIAL